MAVGIALVLASVAAALTIFDVIEPHLDPPSRVATDPRTGSTIELRPESSLPPATVPVPDPPATTPTGERLPPLDRATPPALDASWEVPLPANANARFSADTAAVIGDLVVVPGAGRLAAYDLATGATRWDREWPVARLATSPVLGAGGLVVVPGLGELCTVEATTGADRWCRPVGQQAVVAVAGEDLLVAGSVLVALDPASGEERWRADLGGLATRATPTPLADALEPDGDVVYVSTTHAMGAVELGSGSMRWVNRELLGARVLRSGGDLLFGSAGLVGALDPATGVTRWTVATPDLRPVVPEAVASGRLYGTSGGVAVAFDLAERVLVWAESVSSDWSGTHLDVVDGDLVVIGDRLTVLRLPGQDRQSAWGVPTATRSRWGVAITDGVALVVESRTGPPGSAAEVVLVAVPIA